jgi:hypothetical protein
MKSSGQMSSQSPVVGWYCEVNCEVVGMCVEAVPVLGADSLRHHMRSICFSVPHSVRKALGLRNRQGASSIPWFGKKSSAFKGNAVTECTIREACRTDSQVICLHRCWRGRKANNCIASLTLNSRYFYSTIPLSVSGCSGYGLRVIIFIVVDIISCHRNIVWHMLPPVGTRSTVSTSMGCGLDCRGIWALFQ